MTAKELAETILRLIGEGSLDPQAIVVRPLCSEERWVEVRCIDQVVRRLGDEQGDSTRGLFETGDAPRGVVTVKLG